MNIEINNVQFTNINNRSINANNDKIELRDSLEDKKIL